MARELEKTTTKLIYVRKIVIFLITILLITSGFSILAINSGFASDDSSGTHEQATGSSSRSSRTIQYTMNLSRPGRHQDMTIIGSRELESPFENPPIRNSTMGDVNGDGIDDLIIGAPGDDYNNRPNAGMIYVMFGMINQPTTFDLRTEVVNLTIYGNDTNEEGSAVAVGDFNGDNYDDIISGAPGVDEVHIFYGGPYLNNIPAWDLGQITDKANVTIYGNISGATKAFGASLAIGDLNLDNFEDLIIGAPLGDGVDLSSSNPESGEVVIIRGLTHNYDEIKLYDWPNVILLPGINITTIYGTDAVDLAGSAVCAGGDFNGDGYNDVAFSAPYADGALGFNLPDSGEVYVLYYRPVMPIIWELSNPVTSANFTLYGNNTDEKLGEYSLTFGDINNDNLGDLIVGSPSADALGGKSRSGTTTIIHGLTEYQTIDHQEWNLVVEDANVTIAFPTSEDQSGTWVDSFDWNGDNIDDIVVSAPYADGPADADMDIGEVVIINGSSNIPKWINLETYSPAFYIYGGNESDNFGRMVTHGDFDGDNIVDLIAFASGADGVNNARFGAGEIYKISGAISKAPSINKLLLKNGAGTLGNICYTKLRAYEFEINITAPLGFADLENVTFIIDPNGLALEYYWDRASDTFTVINDTEGYTELISTSDNSTSNVNNWTLSFNIDFNWTCPYGDLLPVRVELINKHNYHIARDFIDVFEIENRLNFTGTLLVKDGDQNVLSDNDWVLGGEPLTWTGLTVIYENSTDVYPHANQYDVRLWNATKSWLDAQPSGSPINISSIIGPNSLDPDQYLLNITQIPLMNDISNITFKLRIDTENIGFSNYLPSSDVWQTDPMVTCGITATDYGGNQVAGDSIQYRLSMNNGTWSNWTSAGVTNDATSLPISSQLHFEESAENRMQWRGNDTIGNGYQLSNEYFIKVDSEDVQYSNAIPISGQKFNSKNVNFSIDISDNTSGVNTSTIEYAISKNNGELWSGWTNLGLVGIKPSVHANASREFGLGMNNIVKWRATDAAGNGPIESIPQRINIFIQSYDLRAYQKLPTDDGLVGNATPTLRWESSDNSSNIVFDVYINKSYSAVLNYQTLEPTKVTQDRDYIVTTALEDKATYYWIVIPRNQAENVVGISSSGVWSFKIDLSVPEVYVPDITLLYPVNNIEIRTLKPTFRWEMEYTNPDYTGGIVFYLRVWTNSKTNPIIEEIEIAEIDFTLSTIALQDLTGYNWTITAHRGGLTEEYESSVGQFKTKLPPQSELPDFKVKSDKRAISIKQGENGSITISVVNLRNIGGDVDLAINSDTLPSSFFTLSSTAVTLSNSIDDEKTVTVTIAIPENYEADSYKFTVVGTMHTAIIGDFDKSVEIDLTVTLKNGGGGGGGGGKSEEDSTMSYAIIGIVIAIVVVLLILFLMLSRKKKSAAEEEAALAAEPEAETIPTALPMAAPAAAVAAPVPGMAEPVPLEEAPAESMEPAALESEPGVEAEAGVEAAAPAPAPLEPMQPALVSESLEPAQQIETTEPAPALPPATEVPPVAEVPPAAEAVVPPEPIEPEPALPSDLPSDAYQEPPAPVAPAPAAPAPEPAAVAAAPAAPAAPPPEPLPAPAAPVPPAPAPAAPAPAEPAPAQLAQAKPEDAEETQ